MSKSTHFFGQPVYGQLINCLNKDKIVAMSRNHGSERCIKSFDGWHHLLTMLYAVILRFDSLREIEASMLAEVRKLGHLGLKTIPKRSTLSDASARRSEKFFEDVYRDLFETNKATLCSDSRNKGTEAWIKRLSKGEISHIARIVSYVDIKNGKQLKLMQLLTNGFDMPLDDIVLIY